MNSYPLSSLISHVKPLLHVPNIPIRTFTASPSLILTSLSSVSPSVPKPTPKHLTSLSATFNKTFYSTLTPTMNTPHHLHQGVTSTGGWATSNSKSMSMYVNPTTTPWNHTGIAHRKLLCTVTTHDTRNENEKDDKDNENKRQFHWLDKEAHELIGKAYTRHKALADNSQSYPPSLSVVDLEKIGEPYHYTPQNMTDKLALGLMKTLRVFVHLFFREKYDHHAVCLETVAAVPGMVASFHRHLRSLRLMRRDHGWISILQEEAENERMHLLIFMKVCQPTLLERALVRLAQGLYLTFYSSLYLIHPTGAHRLTGYLEEEAHDAYTHYLSCLDQGKIENKPAPDIAIEYYQLKKDARMRDVILHVRADEAMHRDVNHQFGNMYQQGKIDAPFDDNRT